MLAGVLEQLRRRTKAAGKTEQANETLICKMPGEDATRSVVEIHVVMGKQVRSIPQHVLERVIVSRWHVREEDVHHNIFC
jgi:hypothetical protein